MVIWGCEARGCLRQRRERVESLPHQRRRLPAVAVVLQRHGRDTAEVEAFEEHLFGVTGPTDLDVPEAAFVGGIARRFAFVCAALVALDYFLPQPACLLQASCVRGFAFSHCVIERVSLSDILLFMQVQ